MLHRHPKGNTGLGCKVKLDEDTGKLNTSFRAIVGKTGVLVQGPVGWTERSEGNRGSGTSIAASLTLLRCSYRDLNPGRRLERPS